ncbi:DMT family transporter [Achromobacter seleniivolatilans]|uniref:DMT family transporter n=1 Tax=Achromobacter seleniivolatilans TaxID=3047478 RepID=A0ABY9M9P6_9BURK|nr:DMT family transporter [Achromobacter sp. R39]WMD23705.1 DMT family transporter [Achromobacter sp. R39]
MIAPPRRLPLDALATSVMLALCVCWGFQQIAIKLVASDIAPIMQIGLRSAFAAVVLAVVVARSEGLRAFSDGTAVPGLIVGLLFAGEFLFVAQGLVYTTASHMSVFLYTAPIFAALGLHWLLPEERMKPLQWLGVAVAFCGIVIAFLGKPDQAGDHAGAPNMLLGDAMGLAAGLLWGATTVAIRKTSLSEAAPAKTLLYQMAVASIGLLVFAVATGHHGIRYTPAAIASVAFQSVVVALSSYLAWFWLLRRYLASRLSILSFMTPLFGVTFGVLILDEPLDSGFVIGAVLVLAGITLVSGAEMVREWLRKRRG